MPKLKDMLDEHSKANMISYAAAGCIIVLFFMILNHLPVIGEGINTIFKAVSAFIYGFVIAFLLMPFRRLVENRWLKKTKLSFKSKRMIAVLLSIVLLFLILIGFFAILIPQLSSSIRTFVTSFGTYVDNLESLLSSGSAAFQGSGELASTITSAVQSIGNSITSWLTSASGGFTKILSAGVSVVSGIFNFFIGVIVAVYLLYDEEKFKRTFKKIIYALLPKKGADWIRYVYGLNRIAFNGFIFGKIIDSAIIGVLCYICVLVMNIPYPILIAVIIGVTNIIPVFGPFIGAIPCLIILVIIDPWAALKFLIFIIILQQIDGNIIGPRILGGSLGLPTLWIMFAIIVGGSLFGIVGMIIGVPVFSVLYTLIRDFIEDRLKKKQIVIEQ